LFEKPSTFCRRAACGDRPELEITFANSFTAGLGWQLEALKFGKFASVKGLSG
jgi:hypothetical protein